MSADKKSPASSILKHYELERCHQTLTTFIQTAEITLSSPHNNLNAWMDAESILKNIAANIEEVENILAGVAEGAFSVDEANKFLGQSYKK